MFITIYYFWTHHLQEFSFILIQVWKHNSLRYVCFLCDSTPLDTAAAAFVSAISSKCSPKPGNIISTGVSIATCTNLMLCHVHSWFLVQQWEKKLSLLSYSALMQWWWRSLLSVNRSRHFLCKCRAAVDGGVDGQRLGRHSPTVRSMVCLSPSARSLYRQPLW